MLINWDCQDKAKPKLCRNTEIPDTEFSRVSFLFFVLGFEVLVGVLGVFLLVAFKSRDIAFFQTLLILEVKTSILSKTQPFWLLLDF